MAKYYTGQVRFDGSDRTYTVNCGPWFSVGQRVMVKMREAQPRLQVATVVSHGQGRNVCRHSVVCHEEELSTYVDPDKVHTLEDFDRFLRSHRMLPLPVNYTGQWDDPEGDRGWTTGYFPNMTPKKLEQPYVQGGGHVILIGPNGLGIHRPSGIPGSEPRLFLKITEGVVQFDVYNLITPIPLDPERMFQSYMEWSGIERGEEVEYQQRDRTLSDIADAIGHTGDGVYLGDGEYL